MIASRKVDRLMKAAEEMKASIEDCHVELMECNIRKEDSVSIHSFIVKNISSSICICIPFKSIHLNRLYVVKSYILVTI